MLGIEGGQRKAEQDDGQRRGAALIVGRPDDGEEDLRREDIEIPPSTSGLPKSAMLSTKPSRKALASPGRISGSEIVVNVFQRLARKVWEASSSEGLMPCTTPISTRKAMGVKARSCDISTPGRP